MALRNVLATIAALWSLLTVVTAAVPATVGGVSPTVVAAADRPFATVQPWLDADFITPDAPPGGFLQAGFTFWDTGTKDFAKTDGVYVRLHPKNGTARPSEGKLESDFPGHVVATVEVPKGGPGAVEVGLLKGSCDSAGGCVTKDTPLRIAGTGPPPDAPPGALLTASFNIVGDVVVGRPYLLTVEVVPRGQWELGGFALPQHLVVTAGHTGQPPLAQADVTPAGPPGAPYTGHVTIPQTGDIDLTVEVPAPAGDQVIADSTTQVTVVEGGRQSASPAASPASSPESGASGGGFPLPVWAVGIALIVVAAAFVLRRVLADL